MNSVIMSGRLTKDVEVRTTPSGLQVANFSIAVEKRERTNSGEHQADFFSCVAWRQTAEFISRWFSKGRKIIVRGSLQNREYTAQDGTARRVTEIIVEEADFADSKGSNAEQAQPESKGFTPAEEENFDDLPFERRVMPPDKRQDF